MEDFSKEDRGIFQGIKVPFCLNAIILAFMAYVIFIAGSHVLGWIMQDNLAYEKVVLNVSSKAVVKLPVLEQPLNEIVLPVALIKRNPDLLISNAYNKYVNEYNENPNPTTQKLSRHEFVTPKWWQYFIFAFWFLLIWSFFAGAINRTAAYRIARDESITLREGLNFGAQTWANHFLAIVFIVIFLAASFFMCVLASFILGYIPYVGELVLIFVFLLIFVAAFLITLLLAGLLFGFNMISSAIGVDKVDSFDAISRSYSYVLGRPWQTLLYTILPLVFVVIFLYFGSMFLDVSKSAVRWGLGGEAYAPMGAYFNVGADVTWESIAQDLGMQEEPRITMKIAATVIKIFIWLAQLFIYATAIAYWLSARTKAYLLLRKEVDGDEVEEMYLEEEEEALEVPPAAAPPAEEADEAKPAAKKEEESYTKDDLEKLSMDELRAVGKELDVTGRSKDKIIERILDAQKKK